MTLWCVSERIPLKRSVHAKKKRASSFSSLQRSAVEEEERRNATQQRGMYVCRTFSEHGLDVCSSGICGLATQNGIIISAAAGGL